MTATGKPDDDHEVERPEPGQPAQPPPPSQWLDDQEPSAFELLPEDDPEPDDLEDTDDPEPGAPESGPPMGDAEGAVGDRTLSDLTISDFRPETDTSEITPPPVDDGEDDRTLSDFTISDYRPESGASQTAEPVDDPEDDPENDIAERTISDHTLADFTPRESTHTMILPGRKAAAGGNDPQQDTGEETRQESPQPAAPPPATSTDIPAQASPYSQESADVTRAERLPSMPLQQPPPPSQSPPAHEPFPYAQEIPDAPAPAHEPFPYAQQIPDAPAPAHEPFPYAQQIPGPPSPPPAAEPFPWAQQMPGPAQHGQPAPGPAAPPPPVIDEPWRTGSPGKRPKGSRNVKKPLLIGLAGLAAAALVAAGVIVVPGLLEGDDDPKTGAELAGSIFPVNGSARTDGRDQEMTGVAAVDETVVAVGGETDPQNARGLFLVSEDGGRTFESVQQQSTDGGAAPPGGIPEAVGGSGDGWVAIGSRAGGGGAVWLSEDGREWRRQPDAVGDVFGPNNRVQRIAATGNGYLAIGENSKKGDFSDAEPAVWRSDDGQRWEPRVGEQIGLQVSAGEFTLVEAAVSGDVILLEGLVTPGGGKDPYRRVWRSDDGGRTWGGSNVPVPNGSRGLMIGGGEGGFVAVREMGSSGNFYGQTYTSKDGSSWSKAGTLKTDGYKHTSRIVGDARGYAAVVVRDRDVLLSRSADGSSWKDAGAAEMKPGLKVTGAALGGGQTVLVGEQSGGGDKDPMLGVWDDAGTAVPVDLAKIPGVVRPDHAVTSVGATENLAVAVGSASGDAAVWSSRDLGAWTPAQGLGAAFTRPGPQQLTDVAGGASGWLAVGYDQAAPRGPLVVTSADGATWQAADSDSAFAASEDGVPVTQAAAAGDAGYVVVGTQGFSVATWSSTDLKNWERGTGAEPEMMEGSKDAGRWMLDVATGSSGYTAVGGSRGGEGNRPSVWTSPDGKKWTLQELQLPGGGVTEAHLTHVAARGSTLVATGIAATPEGLDWLGYVSADGGRSWNPLKSPSEGTQVTVTALAATPDGFAATGTTGAAGSTDVVSWTSADGSAWTATTPGGTGLGGVGDQQITGLASFKNTLLGVGRSADSNGDQPVLWRRN